ncbi:hypothetical protein BH11BAC3_BH11BAC3_03880 [soil metagenome]
MKKQSTTLFTQISKEVVNNLTTIVSESLVKNYLPERSKVFSSADLWNIQRQKRALVQRRYAL